MKITLQAKSSGDQPYTVDFLVDNETLAITCNCKAGVHRQLCKHKTELMAGDRTRLRDTSQADQFQRVQALLRTAPEITQLASEIATAENIVRQEQAKVKSLKKQFAALLQSGVKITEDVQ